jgi:hypothetical protein
MRKKIMKAGAVLLGLMLSACSGETVQDTGPLIGLSWLSEYDTVKGSLGDYNLIRERENTDTAQKMLDYSGVSLFGQPCDVTLCFTESGLIGLNYHDVEKAQSYSEWYSTLENAYGLPTEAGSGMASWYDDPLGKNTAVYLFNLEEGVQVSYYVTADSPDRRYKKEKRQNPIMTPELRTPVMPVAVDVQPSDTGHSEAGATQEAAAVSVTETRPQNIPDVPVTEAVAESAEGAAVKNTTVSAAVGEENTETKKSETETAAEQASTAVEQTETADRKKEFMLNGLTFYGSPADEQQKLQDYRKRSEYRIEEAGQPWELIHEYGSLKYLGIRCDGILCYTSLGLVGLNYFDSNPKHFSDWKERLTEIYGSPDESQRDYTAWTYSPIGEGTEIYIFLLEDGVQISFFADDTGSELAK